VIDISPVALWGLIVLLGIGTFLIRYSFIGLIGDREMPEWLLRHLRYTSVAVFPALVAPLVVWPAAAGGEAEPARITAAVVTVAVGVLSKNVLLSILCGIGTLYGMLALMG
jgi:branched-subunit amino acid transport protein